MSERSSGYYRTKTHRVNGKDYGPYWYKVRGIREGDRVLQKVVKYIGKDRPIELEAVSEEMERVYSDISKGVRIFRSGKPFVVFDFETTGFSPKTGDKVIEAAFKKYVVRDGLLVELEVFHQYLNPGFEIPPEITELTGITNDMVMGKPSMPEVIGRIVEFIGKHRLVGHNLAFDLRFLDPALRGAGMRPVTKKRTCDTMKMSRVAYGTKTRGGKQIPHNLQECAEREHVSISPSAFHSAFVDVDATAGVFLSIARKVDGGVVGGD